MSSLLNEVDANYARFAQTWAAELPTVMADLAKHDAKYLASYRRLVSLNSWRGDLLQHKISPGSLSFALECQNDALVSHVLARVGSWRVALQALRSAIDNLHYCLFYMDHPVELELWASGKHRLAFSELHAYLSRHPRISDVPEPVSGLPLLQTEYATLSRAVHGSATFRMTGGTEATLLWSSDVARLGAWGTREANVLAGMNLLLVTVFREDLQGTKLPNLRRAAGLAIPTAYHAKIKKELSVTIPTA